MSCRHTVLVYHKEVNRDYLSLAPIGLSNEGHSLGILLLNIAHFIRVYGVSIHRFDELTSQMSWRRTAKNCHQKVCNDDLRLTSTGLSNEGVR